MNKELKQKWVEALRSGNYKQGQEYLYQKHEDKYCCLGVLCKIAGENPIKISDETGADELPQELLYKYGLTSDEQSILVTLNDGGRSLTAGPAKYRKHSFTEIADYIDRNL